MLQGRVASDRLAGEKGMGYRVLGVGIEFCQRIVPLNGLAWPDLSFEPRSTFVRCARLQTFSAQAELVGPAKVRYR